MGDRIYLAKCLSSAKESLHIVERQAIHTANLPSQKILRSLLDELESAVAEAEAARDELDHIAGFGDEYDNWPACEVCGKPSMHMVNDLDKYPENGRIACKPTWDSPHYFCEDHNRESRTNRINC